MDVNEFKLLREKADNGDLASMLELALAYKNGVGIKTDLEEFFR